MKCPICDARCAVVESRVDENGYVRRRRWCKCGHRFTSVEIPLEVLEANVSQRVTTAEGAT